MGKQRPKDNGTDSLSGGQREIPSAGKSHSIWAGTKDQHATVATRALEKLQLDDKENIPPSGSPSEMGGEETASTPNLTHSSSSQRKYSADLQRDADTSSLDETTALNPQDVFLEVKATADRGLAVFATRKIKAGTLVLSHRPLFSLSKDEEDDHSAIEREFSKLTRPVQKTFLKLFDAEKSRMSRVVSIYYSNCYNLDPFARDGKGGSAIGGIPSRFNHSCIPNVQFSYNVERDRMEFYAIKDIARGKELCSNYEKNVFEVSGKRKRKLQMYYGFVCRCEACEGAKKNEFWAKSDERRKAMLDVFKDVQKCEKAFLQDAQGNDKDDQVVQRKASIMEQAFFALHRLESLLQKEGLAGVVMANTYRSLSKWSERKGDTSEAIRWKEMEQNSCIMGFGAHTLRAAETTARLLELKRGLKV